MITYPVPQQLKYMLTKSNLADDASCEMSTEDLLHNKCWINGPKIMLQLINTSSDWNDTIGIHTDNVEVKEVEQLNSLNIKNGRDRASLMLSH